MRNNCQWKFFLHQLATTCLPHCHTTNIQIYMLYVHHQIDQSARKALVDTMKHMAIIQKKEEKDKKSSSKEKVFASLPQQGVHSKRQTALWRKRQVGIEKGKGVIVSPSVYFHCTGHGLVSALVPLNIVSFAPKTKVWWWWGEGWSMTDLVIDGQFLHSMRASRHPTMLRSTCVHVKTTTGFHINNTGKNSFGPNTLFGILTICEWTRKKRIGRPVELSLLVIWFITVPEVIIITQHRHMNIQPLLLWRCCEVVLPLNSLRWLELMIVGIFSTTSFGSH